MFISKFLRSSLAVLLIIASLLGMLPGVYATEAEEQDQLVISEDQLMAASDDTTYEDVSRQLDDILYNEAGIDESNQLFIGDPEFPYFPEEDEKGATRSDVIADKAYTPTYIFLDFKAGSKSRDFNWQGQGTYASSDDTRTNYYHPSYNSDNPIGLLGSYYETDDPRVFMPIDTTAAGKSRLGNYVLQSGDIVQVRINHITANALFKAQEPADGYAKMTTYFTVCTSGTIDAAKAADKWYTCGTDTLWGKTSEQIVNFKINSARVGETLYALRYDPLQKLYQDGTAVAYDFPKTTIFIDYIYVGPKDRAPVKVTYRNETDTANMKIDGADMSYVGWGQGAPYCDHGQTNEETSTTQTAWGWMVYQDTDGDGTYEDMRKFITDPTTFPCEYNTKFVLKKLSLRKQNPSSTQEPENEDPNDDKYKLTIDGFDTATLDLGKYGKPLNITLVLDRSGSQSEFVGSTKNGDLFSVTTAADMTEKLKLLDKSKWPGYYRATCWRKNSNKGSSSTAATEFVFNMPMRYYQNQWQMQIIEDCTCESKKDYQGNQYYKYQDYGIFSHIKGKGMKQCSHVKWVSMSTAFSTYKSLLTNQGSVKENNAGTVINIKTKLNYTIEDAPFQFGVCRMGKLQDSVDDFVNSLVKSTKNLAPGQKHSISILSYGASVYIKGYPFRDWNGDCYKSNSTNGYNLDLSLTCTDLDSKNYRSIINMLRQPLVVGSTRTDAAFELLAGTLNDIEEQAGYKTATQSATNYIKARDTSRKRIVVFTTDGVPTSNISFNATLANDAVKASKTLKADNTTTVYAIGIMKGLNASIDTIQCRGVANPKEANQANDFLNSISSRYKYAEVYNTGSTNLTKGNYYMSSDAAGSQITAAMEKLWQGEAVSLGASGKTGLASLWLYEHFGREWKIDSKQTVKIWGEAYVGNGQYSGKRILIGEHKITDVSKAASLEGNGYILHVEPFEDQSFALNLQWKDAKSAFLREESLSTDTKAKAIKSGESLDVSKGYKVYMEIPIEVDRNNTLGGNNIPLTKEGSGCYKANGAADTAKGEILFAYSHPDANVYTTVGSEAHDYFLTLDEYIDIVINKDNKTLTSVMEKMARMPEDVKVANDKGLSNCDYVKFDVSLTAPSGKTLYHKGVANYSDKTLSNSVYDFDNTNNAVADLSKDQIFTMTVSMTHKTKNIDFFGRAPYENVNQTFDPTYYVPKFAVVDYGDSVSVPMDLEGRKYATDNTRITDVSGGSLSVANGEGKMKLAYSGQILNAPTAATTYTYTTNNIPMGATSTKVNREIIMIPGNIVAYDDTVIDFQDTGWSTVGTKKTIEQTYNNATIHGYDPLYNSADHFHGSVRVAEVNKTNTSYFGEFTFTGTGFELISKTTKDSGVIVAEVCQGTETNADTLIKSIVCNTYLSTDDYHQVPVIRWDGDYGTYTVRLTVLYNVIFAIDSSRSPVSTEKVRKIMGYDDSVDLTYIPTKSETATRAIRPSYKGYIDGIRIFNTLKSSPLVDSVYSLAGESVADFANMYDIVLDSTNWDGEHADGMLYLAEPQQQTGSGDVSDVGTVGFPLLMEGTIHVLSKTINGITRYFYQDQNDNQVKDPTYGSYVWADKISNGNIIYMANTLQLPVGNLIIAAKDGYNYFGLENSLSLSGTIINPEDGVVSKEDEKNFVLVMEKSGKGITVKSGSQYLSCSSDGTTLGTSTSAYVWTLGESKLGTVHLVDSTGKMALCYFPSTGKFGMKALSDMDPTKDTADYGYYGLEILGTSTSDYSQRKTLSRAYVESIMGEGAKIYTSTYKSYGAKGEVILKNGSGVAFGTAGSTIYVSLKSTNGQSCTVEVWNGNDWEDYKDPAGNTPLQNLTTATEQFYDFSHYNADGGIIIKNTGEGLLSVVHVKTSIATKGIQINKELAMKAIKAFETPVDAVVTNELKLSHSLNLRSNISINYIVAKSALEGYEFYELTAEVAGKTYEIGGVEKGNYVYFILEGLNAAMMNDNVRAQLKAYAGDEVYVSPVDDYSIAAYAYTMMNREGGSEHVKSLCANILRYGSATQIYTGYNADALADEEMTAEQMAYLRDLDSVEFGAPYTILDDVATPSVTWQGRTLILDSTVAVKLMVHAPNVDAQDMELRVSYTGIDGTQKALTVAPTVQNGENGVYTFTIGAMDAAELRSVLTCCVYVRGEAASKTMLYSADSYGNNKTGNLLTLCKALFAYVDEARAFFG